MVAALDEARDDDTSLEVYRVPATPTEVAHFDEATAANRDRRNDTITIIHRPDLAVVKDQLLVRRIRRARRRGTIGSPRCGSSSRTPEANGSACRGAPENELPARDSSCERRVGRLCLTSWVVFGAHAGSFSGALHRWQARPHRRDRIRAGGSDCLTSRSSSPGMGIVKVRRRLARRPRSGARMAGRLAHTVARGTAIASGCPNPPRLQTGGCRFESCRPCRMSSCPVRNQNSCIPDGRRLLLWASLFRRLPRQIRVIATMT